MAVDGTATDDDPRRVPRASILNDPLFRSIIVQLLLTAALVALVWWIAHNTIVNLRRLNIASGFDFLWARSGFDIGQTLIRYTQDSTYARALVVGLLNTLLVAALGIVFATILGAVLAAGLFAFSPQVRERFERTSAALTADRNGVDVALSGRTRIWGAALCMIRMHPVNGVGARDFRDAFPACDPEPGQAAAWGDGPAFHAHQWVLEVLSETGVLGLLLWIAGIAMAWRAWRYAPPAARDRARPPMIALVATLFPFNTHLAFYSTFWGGVSLMLAALYAGSLLGRERAPARDQPG